MKFTTASMIVATTATSVAAQESIAAIATETDSLSTLVDLVTMADLVSAIDGSSGESITVFAPTNEAFGTLPSELVTNLMTPAWGAHLSSILETHIVDSVIPSSAITEATSVTTLSGEIVDVTIDPIAIDGAVVSVPDIEASNGVVHVIDGVITPAWIEKTLPVAASEVSGVSTLVSLLASAELVEALSATGPFTVFAPTNAAFEALGEATTKCVTENTEILTSVLLYHVVSDLVPAAEVPTAMVTTLESSAVDIDADALTVNTANIVGADALLANNGIAHLIDEVLVPSSVGPNITACVAMAMEAEKSIAAIATETDSLSTLVDLVTMADLVSAIDGSSGESITVFAPTNEAFGTLPSELVTNLMTPAWGAHLSSILKTHIVDSVIPSSAITEATSVPTLSGEMVNITIDPIAIDGAVVSVPDIEASNGVVHVIDGVITPAWIEKTLPVAASEVAGVSTLVSLLASAELVEALSATGPFTVFAPTNAAFEALGEATTKCVTENTEILTSVLLYHVVSDLVPAAEVPTAMVTTLESSAVDIDADALTVNTANIVGADALLANNGIAHLIDAVLVPSSVGPNITACLEMAMDNESGASTWTTGLSILAAAVWLALLF